MKGKREYIDYLNQAIRAITSSIDRFNSIYDPYGIESSLVLSTNAWELLAKAYLLKNRKSIRKNYGYSINAETAVHRLVVNHALTEIEEDHIQQIISLRNEVTHSLIRSLPKEVSFHLQFYGVKFFKDFVIKVFPNHARQLKGNFLAISFDTLTTYADKVQGLIGRLRKGTGPERRLVWLLERGIRFDGASYMSQNAFDAEIKRLKDKKILPHLRIGSFVKQAEMVRIIAVQAPKGYTADVNIRKGSNKSTSALPVFIKKTEVEEDYPYLTYELAEKLSKGRSIVAKAIAVQNLKGNPEFHQSVRSSKSGKINRYTEKAFQYLQGLFRNKTYNPYRMNK